MRRWFIVFFFTLVISMSACENSQPNLDAIREDAYEQGFSDGVASEQKKDPLESMFIEDQAITPTPMSSEVDSGSFTTRLVSTIDELAQTTGLKCLDATIWHEVPKNEENYIEYGTTIEMQRNLIGNTYLKPFSRFGYDIAEIGGTPHIIGRESMGTFYVISITESILTEMLKNDSFDCVIFEMKISDVASSINYYSDFEYEKNIPEYGSIDTILEYASPSIDGEFNRIVKGSCQIVHFVD